MVIALGSLSRITCMTISQEDQVVVHKIISISNTRNREGWGNTSYSDM